MSGLTIFFIGLLVGWVLEWIIDRYFWRATEEEIQSAQDCQEDKVQLQAQLDAAQTQIAVLQAQAATAEAKIDELELAVEEATTKLVVRELEEEDEEGAEAAAAEIAEAVAEPEVVEPDDLTAIEGIGPKIDGILKAAGIQTFAQLAQADVAHLDAILEGAGSRYKLAVPDTWPQQAALAARGEWDALEALQDSLSGGRRADEDDEEGAL